MIAIAMFLGVIVGVFVALFIQALFLLLGAKLAGIEDRTFGRALGTAFLGGIASFIVSAILGFVPLIGHVLGLVCGFLISALIMKAIFTTTLGKAAWAMVIAWILTLIIFGGVMLLLMLAGVGLGAMALH